MSAVGVAADLWAEARSIYWEGFPAGWSLIVVGHGHLEEALAEVGIREWGDDISGVTSSEEWLSFHKRIKWCDRLTGFGCDMAGDWHSHWEPVRANPAADDAKWTLIRPVYRTKGGDA